MKAIVIHEFCDSLDQIHVSNVIQLVARPDEIIIKVIAAGVNFVDCLYARGKHQNNRSLVTPPFTLGLEFSGLVVSAPQTSPFRPGDGVFGDYGGSYSEFISLPADSPSIRKIPQGWGFVEAAGLAATLPVSYGALVSRGNLKSGESVLVHAAAGSLGIMAVQIAKAHGCHVIGTAGSAEKCEYAVKHGADVCYNYTTDPDWWRRVLDATGGQGVDVVFDPVGLVDLSLKCTRHRGRVLVVGFAGREGQMEHIAMNRVLLKQVTLIGYRFGESLRRYPGEKDELWRGVEKLLQSGKIRPVVQHTYDGLESVSQALRDLMDRKIAGKAVIKVGSVPTDSKPRL